LAELGEEQGMRSIPWELPRRHRWATRIVLAVALAVALGYGPHRAAGGADAQIARLAAQLDETRASINEIDRENARLRERVRALKDEPRAIEELARRDLGLVMPGEIVIDLKRPPAGAKAAEAR
jgi:cell division protein FtsB